MGVHEAIFSSVMNINDKYHDDLLGNIVLNGGNMMFPGMTERLQKELEGLISKNMKNSHPKVVINAPK